LTDRAVHRLAISVGALEWLMRIALIMQFVALMAATMSAWIQAMEHFLLRFIFHTTMLIESLAMSMCPAQKEKFLSRMVCCTEP
jgi:hypothetical protein